MKLMKLIDRAGLELEIILFRRTPVILVDYDGHETKSVIRTGRHGKQVAPRMWPDTRMTVLNPDGSAEDYRVKGRLFYGKGTYVKNWRKV